MNIQYIKNLPTVNEYNELSENVGWGKRDSETLQEAFRNSIYGVSAYIDGKLVGCGRIIGDKTIFLHIHDLIVSEELQGQGIGREIMNMLIEEVKVIKKKYPSIRLYLGASKGKESFYSKFGFIERPNDTLGAGMIWKQE